MSAPNITNNEPKQDLTENDVLAKLNELDTDESKDKEDDLDIPDIKEEKVEKKDKKEKDFDTDSEDDEDEDEEETEEDKLNKLDEKEDDKKEIEEEDELKLVIPLPRKEILKTYPDLFRKFPAVERAIYREQAYTEVFPTIKEAKAAVERINDYEKLESSVLNGDLKPVLAKIKELGDDSINAVADNYLQALYQTDQRAYNHVLNNVFRSAIGIMAEQAKKSNNEEQLAAAEIIHKWYFGDAKYEAPSKLSKDKPAEQNELEKQRNEFLEVRFTEARDDLALRIDNRLKSVISEAVDIKKELPDYVKTKVVEDCIRDLHNQLSSDTRVQRIIHGMWQSSSKEKSPFNKDSVSKIGTAYLSVAKSLLRPIIQKNRQMALKGLGRLNNNDNQERTKFKGSENDNGRDKSERPKGKMRPGESITDFLTRD